LRTQPSPSPCGKVPVGLGHPPPHFLQIIPLFFFLLTYFSAVCYCTVPAPRRLTRTEIPPALCHCSLSFPFLRPFPFLNIPLFSPFSLSLCRSHSMMILIARATMEWKTEGRTAPCLRSLCSEIEVSSFCYVVISRGAACCAGVAPVCVSRREDGFGYSNGLTINSTLTNLVTMQCPCQPREEAPCFT
jgi:hypothetical protein